MRELCCAEGREAVAEEDARPEGVLEFFEGFAEDATEGGCGEGGGEEGEVSSEDAEGLVELGGDGELGGVVCYALELFRYTISE